MDIFQIPIYMYVAYTQEGDTDTNTETNIALYWFGRSARI